MSLTPAGQSKFGVRRRAVDLRCAPASPAARDDYNEGGRCQPPQPHESVMRKHILTMVAVRLLGLTPVAQQPAPPAATQPPAQQPPVTFKVEINYVEVDAAYTDQQGNVAATSTKDDFQGIRGWQAAGDFGVLAGRHPD